MPSPQELFNQLMEAAKENVAAAETEKQKTVARGNEQLVGAVKQLAVIVPKMAEQNQAMAARIEALESMKTIAPRQTSDEDPYSALGEFGIEKRHMAPVVQREVGSAVQSAVKAAMEEQFGPALREAQAVQKYQESHPDFDLMKMRQFLAKDEEARNLVARAAQAGAYDVGIEYAETRRQIAEQTTQEQNAQRKGVERRSFVAATRPDAQVLGGGATNGTSRSVKKTLTPEQVQSVFAHAEVNNWKPFEEAFVHDNLPSESWFQALAQS